jgi:hypothetical protein
MTKHCLLVTPPFSPNTSNPLLGPAILKAHAEDAGFPLRCIDLNLQYISMFADDTGHRAYAVGDHDADERQIDRARDAFIQSLCLPEIDSARIPCCDDPNSSLPHSFAEIESSLDKIMRDGFWSKFFEQHIFSVNRQPAVLGISVMGPTQVPLALILAALGKQNWPGTLVIAGGSHITLMAKRIEADERYAGAIDFFAPGHSENVLANTLIHLNRDGHNGVSELPGLLRAGHKWSRNRELAPEDRLPPVFEENELAYYKKGRLTLPLQLGRGCAYGRCTYCTYPVVEQFEKIEVDKMAHRYVPSLLDHSPDCISVKDSLLTMASMVTFGEVLTGLKAPVAWSATTKIHSAMTPEYMRDLAGSGCRTLEMGVETIHESSQKFFDKVEPLENIDAALDAALNADISVVINMIYGIPGETIDDAHKQLTWWRSWKRRAPDRVFGVHNMLQIDEGSPLTQNPGKFGLELQSTGPWSFTYLWNALEWRPKFQQYITENGGRAQ